MEARRDGPRLAVRQVQAIMKICEKIGGQFDLISTPSFSTNMPVTSACILFVSTFVSVRSKLR